MTRLAGNSKPKEKPTRHAPRHVAGAIREETQVMTNSRGFKAGELSAVSLAAALAVLTPGAASAQADFYRGKTINIIVGFGPGGGYDFYPRLMARHMGKYIPGNPAIVVQNMEGAGSMRAANYVYGTAPKDGTVIAAVNQNIPMFRMLGGKSAYYEPEKFQWLGTMTSSNGTLYTWHTSQTKTIEDAMTRETLLGGAGTNSDSHIFPTMLNNLIGTKFKVIKGYASGGREISIAIERGEIEGRGGNTWASLVGGNPDWVTQKKINILIQVGLQREPDLPDTPLLLDFAKSEDDKQVVSLVSLPTEIGFGQWMAPEVPADRLATLRHAYAMALQDPAFLGEAQARGMMIRPKTGEQLGELVRTAAATPQAVRDRTAQVLEWKE
jgi:tripartite-type tricarboxylate transporter receptor subunit TctC